MTYEEIKWEKSWHLATPKEYYQEYMATNTAVEVTVSCTTRRRRDGSAGACRMIYFIEDVRYKSKESFCKALADVKKQMKQD